MGDPIRRCDECNLLRPLRVFDGRALCVDCCPLPLGESDGATDNEVQQAISAVATDGGRE